MALSLHHRGETTLARKRTKIRRESSDSVRLGKATVPQLSESQRLLEIDYSSSDKLLRILSYITFSLFVGLFLIQLCFLWNTYMLLQLDTPSLDPPMPDDLHIYYSLEDGWQIDSLNGQLRVNTTLFVR